MNIPFLKGVNEEILKQILFTSKKYTKGAIVHEQGEFCDNLTIVLSGDLVSYTLSTTGSENIMFEFHADSTIGANLLFGNTNRYPMNIYCQTDCEILKIKKKDIELLLHDYVFMMHFIKSISLNSQGMNKKIVMFTQKTLRQNLIDYLKTLSLEQHSQIIILPISKKQLADRLNVQRPSLFRELKKMKDEKLISVHGKAVKLLNI